MSRTHLLSYASIILFGAIVAYTPKAFATQPLGEFLSGAHSHAFDAQEEQTRVEEAYWQKEAARGRLLPSLGARGTFTRNQYEAGIPPGTFPGQTEALTLTPQNQWDASFQVNVPLVNLSNYARLRQAKHLERAAKAGVDSTAINIDRAVAQSYYAFIGASALVGAAHQSVKAAEENLRYVTTRRELGAATELDTERAKVNLEKAKQAQTDAALIRTIAKRELETLSGILATPVSEYPVDDLRPETPLEAWLKEQNTPHDRIQNELSLAAREAERASSYALLPTLSANAQERVSNATGFSGRNASYTLSAVLSWNLDYSTYAQAQTQAVAAHAQSIRAERTRRAIEDTVFNSHHQVQASIAKSTSARAQAASARRAAELAMLSYRAGAGTQLDVTQSQRDAFQAQAGRIKADADLFFARVLLRLAAGVPPERRSPKTVPSITPQTKP